MGFQAFFLSRQLFSIRKGSHYLQSLVETFEDVTTNMQTASLHDVFSELASVFRKTLDIYIYGRFDENDSIMRDSQGCINLRKLAQDIPIFRFEFLIDGTEFLPAYSCGMPFNR